MKTLRETAAPWGSTPEWLCGKGAGEARTEVPARRLQNRSKMVPGGQFLEEFSQKIKKFEKGGGPKGDQRRQRNTKGRCPSPLFNDFGVIWGAIWGQFRCKIMIKTCFFCRRCFFYLFGVFWGQFLWDFGVFLELVARSNPSSEGFPTKLKNLQKHRKGHQQSRFGGAENQEEILPISPKNL